MCWLFYAGRTAKWKIKKGREVDDWRKVYNLRKQPTFRDATDVPDFLRGTTN